MLIIKHEILYDIKQFCIYSIVFIRNFVFYNFKYHNFMYIILGVLIGHWFVSLFFHTAFLHRYASHKMYEMHHFTERIFYFLTWIFQGPSFLVPRAYAIMHRMHHEYSDTEKDPHSPHFFKDVVGMMVNTKRIFYGLVKGTIKPEQQFTYDLPEWKRFDKFFDSNYTRAVWVLIYSLVYFAVIHFFDLSYFWLLLVPITCLLGPIQGATVNWCGHKYGYQNYDNGDHSHNSSPFGVALMGELFQNNHHMFPDSVNFAKKWFEFDLTYLILKVFNKIGIIRFI